MSRTVRHESRGVLSCSLFIVGGGDQGDRACSWSQSVLKYQAHKTFLYPRVKAACVIMQRHKSLREACQKRAQHTETFMADRARAILP